LQEHEDRLTQGNGMEHADRLRDRLGVPEPLEGAVQLD